MADAWRRLLDYVDSTTGLVVRWPTSPSRAELVATYLASKLRAGVSLTSDHVERRMRALAPCLDVDWLAEFTRVGAVTPDGHQRWVRPAPELDLSRSRDSDVAVRLATHRDLGALQSAYDSCAYVEMWEPETVVDPPGVLRSYIDDGDLPEGGQREHFAFYSIVYRSVVVGYAGTYLGYPTSDRVWITIFVVHARFQGQGIGRRALELLIDPAASCGRFAATQLIVSGRNWPAIRFWQQNGFERVVRVVAPDGGARDGVHYLILERVLLPVPALGE